MMPGPSQFVPEFHLIILPEVGGLAEKDRQPQRWRSHTLWRYG